MKKHQFKRITIIGVGLIGGSIGLAIKKKRIAKEVVGLTTKSKTLSNAKRYKAIDRGTLSLKESVKDSDMVIICTPARTIPQIIKKVLPFLKKGCILTDVASTKAEIVGKIEKLLPKDIHFVGGHPMAGSEKRGVEFASSNLFKDSVCILTKTNKTNLMALNKVNIFFKRIGAKVKIMNPVNHDKIIARVSHLPHLAAVALVRQIKENDIDFVSTGFISTTRVSEAAGDIWRDICLTNKEEILKSLGDYIDALKRIKRKIKSSDSKGILCEFKKAKALREIIKK